MSSLAFSLASGFSQRDQFLAAGAEPIFQRALQTDPLTQALNQQYLSSLGAPQQDIFSASPFSLLNNPAISGSTPAQQAAAVAPLLPQAINPFGTVLSPTSVQQNTGLNALNSLFGAPAPSSPVFSPPVPVLSALAPVLAAPSPLIANTAPVVQAAPITQPVQVNVGANQATQDLPPGLQKKDQLPPPFAFGKFHHHHHAFQQGGADAGDAGDGGDQGDEGDVQDAQGPEASGGPAIHHGGPDHAGQGGSGHADHGGSDHGGHGGEKGGGKDHGKGG